MQLSGLYAQSHSHYALARGYFIKGHRTHGSHAAWAWAMDDTQKRSQATTRVKYPADQLLPVVAAYSACCGATSSGVEGNFSKHMLLGKGRAALKGETLEVNALKLAADINDDERDLIVARARKIWSQFYGVPRLAGKSNRPGHRLGDGARGSFKDIISVAMSLLWL